MNIEVFHDIDVPQNADDLIGITLVVLMTRAEWFEAQIARVPGGRNPGPVTMALGQALSDKMDELERDGEFDGLVPADEAFPVDDSDEY